jgi:hypothetical protein
MQLVEKIVLLNLNPELVQLGKQIASRMRAALGLARTESPQPSTASLQPDTRSTP